ncbi:MAG: hypothetical protein NC041_09670 [Bacteroides sp.]|nr:hypothetical protein [Prevotella sp.]MCM1408645.1 hypothetical protein [Treponema brennaborense]MCM1470719.1 hypothetical protein [Bacteroides sp.]
MNTLNTVRKICALLLAVFAAAIILVSAAAFVSGRAQPGSGLRAVRRHADFSDSITLAELNKNNADAQLELFDGIGQLRIAAADETPVSVVLSPVFPYAENDTAFYEELCRKTQQLRMLCVSYIMRQTQADLLAAGEQSVKEALLDLINAELVLGKIQTIYFTEYMIIE